VNRDDTSDKRPQEHFYESIHKRRVPRTNNCELALTYLHARAENSSEESNASFDQPCKVAATEPVYQPISIGDGAPIYQPLNSDTKTPDVLADNSSKGTMPVPTN